MPKKLYATATNILHLATMFVLSLLWSVKYSLFGSHICFWNCLWNVKLKVKNIFNFAAVFLTSHLWPLRYSSLGICTCFCKYLLSFLTNIHKYFKLIAISVLSNLSSLKYSFFGSHIYFCKYDWCVKWHSQTFYIWQLYLFFNIMPI